MHWFSRIALAAALAFACSLASAGQFVIFGVPSGSIGNQTLSITISPAAEDLGRTGNTYIAAFLPVGGWYFLTAAGWRPWSAGDFPVFATGSLANTTVTPLQELDVSGIPGAAVYAGYGSSAEAMLANGTYALVFVVGSTAPSISGTASCGTWIGPSVTAYGLNIEGSRGSVLAATTADSNGNFTLQLGSYPAGAVEIVATGGTYHSLHDGFARSRDFTLSAFLPSLTGPVGSIAVTPITDFVATRARELLLGGGVTPSEARIRAAQSIETIFGLAPGASAMIPRFDAAAITQTPAVAQLGLLIGALESVGASFYSDEPELAVAALTLDFADGVFDGMKGLGTITVSNLPIATDLGTARLIASSVRYASAYASGLLPAFTAAVAPAYTSRTIPVYVAQTIPPYRAGVPAMYAANPSPITANTRGPSAIGQYACTADATISYEAGTYSCSNGSIPFVTAQPIEPYTPGMVTPYEWAVVGQDVATGTVPVHTSVTDFHVFTQAERTAMNASSTSSPNNGSNGQGALTQPQIDAYEILNHNTQVWYSGNPFR
jgi:hypothetical protein